MILKKIKSSGRKFGRDSNEKLIYL